MMMGIALLWDYYEPPADAVLIASGTLHATAPKHLWIPDSVSPIGTESYTSYRQKELGKSGMRLW